MPNLLEKAITAKRESKHIEFKESFGPRSSQEWCEIIKDIVAIANSGGGIILFGVNNVGDPCSTDLSPVLGLDPADVGNKITKYTGAVDLEFDIREVQKENHKLAVFVVEPVSIPIIFRNPGTYDIGSGRQRTAFNVGTVYFRHGAKSEPGTSDDIRKVIERQLDAVRKTWAKGVRKVVQAPRGAQVITVLPSARRLGSAIPAVYLRVVKDHRATPVVITRDRSKASSVFIHEELSEGIFDEINNVIDANALLAKGQREFFLGLPVYHRIYAERHHVHQNAENISVLFRCAVTQFYAPGLYWVRLLPTKMVAQTLADIFLSPKAPHIRALLRIAMLLGKDFCDWLYGKWNKKWKRHPQPPSFYWTFQEMVSRLGKHEPRVIAARTPSAGQYVIPGEQPISIGELLARPKQAANLLSHACMKVFEGQASFRTIARNLDYLAYGTDVARFSKEIAKAVITEVGERGPGDLGEDSDEG